jgi:hydrogenase maturation protease
VTDNGRTLILGLGNTILSDDAAGIIVARRIYDTLSAHGIRKDVDFAESSYAGWRLIDLMAGYRRVIIVDAIQTDNGIPGDCYRVEQQKVTSLHLQTSHGLGLQEAIELSRQNGQIMPDEVAIYAIEVCNPFEFGEQLTPGIEEKLPAAVSQIIAEEKLM